MMTDGGNELEDDREKQPACLLISVVALTHPCFRLFEMFAIISSITNLDASDVEKELCNFTMYE